MGSERKRIVYIHPKNLGYYEDHEIFSLISGFESYIIADNTKIARSFKHYDKHIVGDYEEVLSPKLYHVQGLKTILHELNPDVVVTKEIFSLQSFLVHKLRKKFNFIHVIISYENTDFNNSLWGLFPITRIISYINRDSIFIAVSDAVQRNLLRVGVKKENIVRTYTGLFPIQCYDAHNGRKEFRILYIGNLFQNKGIITLINAVKNIVQDGFENVYLYIAGQGPLSEYVKSASKDLKNISYLGYVSEEKKMELLNNSDLFVYPSEDMYFFRIIPRWREQTATSVMESMRCGLPVIASNSGSLPEMMGRDNVIFEQGSAGDLKDKIMMVYRNEILRNELKSYFKDRFMHDFDIQKNAKKISEQIDKEMREKSRI
jgi:glycosyltransferase involved in cell wall biosynthesis